jgi:hypothetical protein
VFFQQKNYSSLTPTVDHAFFAELHALHLGVASGKDERPSVLVLAELAELLRQALSQEGASCDATVTVPMDGISLADIGALTAASSSSSSSSSLSSSSSSAAAPSTSASCGELNAAAPARWATALIIVAQSIRRWETWSTRAHAK